MKNLVITLLALAALALGAFCLYQQRQISQTRTVLSAVPPPATNSEAEEKAAFAEKKSAALQETLTQTSAYANEKSKEAEDLQRSLAAAKTNNPMQGMADLFKDPKMRDMIKAQQKAYIVPMLDKQYAALIQQLNLTPEQSAQLKDLLAQRMLAGADAGMSMLDRNLDPAKREEMVKQTKDQTDDYNAQIKQLLGDNYAAFEAYEKTTADRLTVSQFNDQFPGGDLALSADQQQQLIQAMSDERNGFKWTVDYGNRNTPDGDFSTMFTEDKINQYAQERERLDNQILARARPFLSAGQAQALEQFLASQRQMQIAGMKMAGQMFGPKSP